MRGGNRGKGLKGAITKDKFPNSKKHKKQKKEEHVSGDSLADEGLVKGQGSSDKSVSIPSKTKASAKLQRREIRARQRTSKQRRRDHHERERREGDALVRSRPHTFLWEQYAAWAGDKLSAVERAAEQWTKDDVHVVTDDGESNLMEDVRRILGKDFVKNCGWKRGVGLPGIACIALGHGALRAVNLGRRVNDGRPVGKLFGKHIKIDEQRSWVESCCNKKLAPSAVGTAKRIQRLIEEERMTLKHTGALIVDMTRDVRMRNMLDMPCVREELFEFLHSHVRKEVATGRLKIILIIQSEEEMAAMERATKQPKEVGSNGDDANGE